MSQPSKNKVLLLQFRAGERFKTYHDSPDWSDMEVRKVDVSKATYLKEKFGDFFKVNGFILGVFI